MLPGRLARAGGRRRRRGGAEDLAFPGAADEQAGGPDTGLRGFCVLLLYEGGRAGAGYQGG
ncbi:hypothetical protein DB346_21150 [Verrucomicrobia bacterium LW23]|nr:hypothetical protein DB346_21150 [Verrucomicrobia bacterium LW23]